jgi:hypothetical protein
MGVAGRLRRQHEHPRISLRMIGHFADRFNSRRWFIRYLLYAEWVLVVTLVALIATSSL